MRNLNEKRTTYIFAGTIAGAGCLVMIAFPAIALDSAQKGVSLWASSVLPALLPFFICANFMIALGLPNIIGKFFEKSFRAIFDAPGVSAFVFTISITSGYPMGAKLIGDMARRKEISKMDAMKMLSFCSTSGPLFMLGAVGAGMLGSPAAGAVIAGSHYLGALINGLLYRLFYGWKALLVGEQYHKSRKITASKWKDCFERAKEPSVLTGSLLDVFTDSILSAFRALGIICGYIVLFTLITDFIQFSGMLNYIGTGYGKSLVKGFFEMTVGCNSVSSNIDLSLALKCVVCSFLISWGGLSVFAQSMSMLAGLEISIGNYLMMKISHGILAAVLAWFMGPYILDLDIASTGAFGQEELVRNLGFVYQLLFSTKMVIMVIIIFVLTVALEKIMRKIHERFSDHSGV
ncbi:hypothetical protein [Sinanaerobacter chloroacetimidivorans]|jgi:sporulation integral membrane protein YlbJ|uniref:Sporulation integral membrane protein YlbJ n=1 Tax=Sinanaerobacter chloroacetimidivorans TaxID=2818044 RepID=A0A8J7VZL5_9FIRM|nr:hypothetical protein [Sinanaerobacter chloroacetimidivorans]MBR0596535.1 hypothetical protein [Sinanaerobacter chloroacetimidivorans]